ncbi:ABC transporter ATP-binding protein [Kineosporia sp. J2-2]|uniref:ABC transporter ATP-binding protein n=1 Tax=Kineosporia corallincola TaxID=2835133 RepID=A0ABS5TNF7_9ACTN|nr:ABC transporter ATP-binding protein [Kineosporia corallincola]MBT0772525.1 ABC transporter ATP-binding protein [Kineosporia corallincola]
MSLSLENVTLGYDGRVVAPDLRFTVPEGEFTAVIGPNGCGKSTLLKALARTLKPLAGQIILDGEPLRSRRPRATARRIASLPQHPVAPESLRVRDLVARGRHPYHSLLRQWLPGDAELVDDAMAATGVTELADRLLTDLSGGQRQRAWIAMVLAQQTRYVLLDEPTSFLDLAHQVELLHLCQDLCRPPREGQEQGGRTVLAVLHDVNQAARYASHLVVMHEGRIVATGAPADVLNEQLLKDVFGVDAVIGADPQSGTPMVTVRARPARP